MRLHTWGGRARTFPDGHVFDDEDTPIPGPFFSR